MSVSSRLTALVAAALITAVSFAGPAFATQHVAAQVTLSSVAR
jgi:hypothetical protein